MRRILIAALLVALVSGGAALAQEATPPPAPAKDTVTKQVGGATYPVTLPQDQPLVLYAAETIVTPKGQFVRAVVFVNEADQGFIRLTRCDDVVVTCEPITLRAEGINQGDQFYLDGGH